MSADDRDVALLARAREGDEAAFRALYERHRYVVLRFAYRLLGCLHGAQDVVHDCFLGLMERPDGFDAERASLRTYLCGSARHLAFRILRRRGIQIELEDSDAESMPAREDDPLHELIGDETAARIASAVGRLPPLQREALVLFEYEEMSLAEIAAVAGVSVPTVSARIHRARARLRGWLADLMEDPGIPGRRRGR
jgi:RNA polymerase sigma-70 factor (ECF subfamily)